MYNLFLSCALTIASNLTFTDKLLLRMDIDLGLFGTIKGVMFLFPAIIYQFLAPFLGRMQKDIQICAVSYAVRVFLPILLPFLAMVTTDRTLLTWGVMVILPLGMLFAVIANNTLMAVYRKVIPPEKFNYSIGMINLFLNLPTFLMALPVAWLLDQFANLVNADFYLLFGVLQLFTFAFELPAILFLLRVKVPPESSQSVTKINMLAPYQDKKMRLVMLINMLHRVVNGLVLAYLTVYLLEVAHFSMTVIVAIGIALGALLTLTQPYAGKAMDRWGYGRIFILLASAMLLGMFLFGVFWKSLFILPLFALLCWDCNTGPAGGWLTQGGYAASAKLASKENLQASIAAYSICFNGGLFLGLLLASGLYSLAGRMGFTELSERLHIYFFLSLPFFILLLGVTVYFQKVLAASGQKEFAP
jgi:predicted MFS family arabinose efflux permease